MKHLYYCLYFCLILVTYTSSSNAVTNSWCSNGKYSTAISPFPKPQFNKCPGYAKKIMSKKEVREYYINGLGQEYLCKRIKSGVLYKEQDRKDYKAIIELIKGKDTKCDQFFKIKLAEKKAEEDKQIAEANVNKVPKEWCIGAGQYGKQYPIKKKKACPTQARIEITSEEATKTFLSGSGKKYLTNLIANGAICQNDKTDYKFIRELLKGKKDLGCVKQKTLAEKKEEEVAKIRALAEKLAKEEIAKQLRLKQKEEEAKQKAIASRKAKEDKARKKALAKKKAEEVAKQKAISLRKAKENAARKKAQAKKKAEELAKRTAEKKKLAEEEEKRKLVLLELKEKAINYKREASYFYKDIENYVKQDGIIDLVALYKIYNLKPNLKKNWVEKDILNYEKLRNFMTSVPQFVSYERKRIGERLKKSFALKDKSIANLNNNLLELKKLMKKMFGSEETPKIMGMIGDIETTLSNFKQSTANKVLKKSNTYIASKLSKPKSTNKIKKVVSTLDTNWLKLKSNLNIQQQQFCQLTDRFYDNLNKARKSKNEIKVNMVHKERQENLDALIPQGNINNWIFKIIKIDQVEDGSAAVVLGLQCRSYVGSGQTIDIKKGMTRKTKKEWRATIPYDDRRFRELAKLDQGQFIVGSGTMLEINAYKPGQKETFYASQQIGEHPLTKGLNLEGELFIADLSYIAALN